MGTAQLVHFKALHRWLWLLVQQAAALLATRSGFKSSCLKFDVILAANPVRCWEEDYEQEVGGRD